MKRVASVLTCLVLCCGVAQAQSGGDAAARERRQADKRQVVAANLGLSESEAKVFWPVYDGHQTRLATINERTAKLVERQLAAQRGQSADETLATTMIKELDAIKDDEHRAGKALISEVGKVLPPAKGLRYLMLENKLRAGEAVALTESIPVAR